jgi:hypothetical protein
MKIQMTKTIVSKGPVGVKVKVRVTVRVRVRVRG